LRLLLLLYLFYTPSPIFLTLSFDLSERPGLSILTHMHLNFPSRIGSLSSAILSLPSFPPFHRFLPGKACMVPQSSSTPIFRRLVFSPVFDHVLSATPQNLHNGFVLRVNLPPHVWDISISLEVFCCLLTAVFFHPRSRT